jgi:hypothetical protein
VAGSTGKEIKRQRYADAGQRIVVGGGEGKRHSREHRVSIDIILVARYGKI